MPEPINNTKINPVKFRRGGMTNTHTQILISQLTNQVFNINLEDKIIIENVEEKRNNSW